MRRALRRFAASRLGSWLFARVLHRIDRPVYRLTRGRHTFASLVSGLPVVMLTTTGARSGKERTVPVVGLPTPEGLAVIASNYGQERHPAWYHNLLAHPETTIQTGAHVRKVRARLATESERAQWWPRLVAKYPGYEFFQQRAKEREIPIVLFEPAE